jgi:SM-20-related protein
MPYESIARELGRTGLSIVPHFLLPLALGATQADLRSTYSTGVFHRARTGHGAQTAVHEEIRSDEIHWLERASSEPSQVSLWKQLDRLKQAFNRSLFLGLNEFEGHYAVYPTGGYYRRHLDSFSGGGSRVVSLILYLNSEWKSVDGGQLRVYDKDGTYREITPVGGTLVCFLSQVSEHQVMPSLRRRESFSGWYTRYERS